MSVAIRNARFFVSLFHFNNGSCLISDISRGKTVLLKQRRNLTRLSELVLNSDSEHGNGTPLADGLRNGRAKSTDNIMLLGGNDGTCLLCRLQDDF